MWSQLGNTFISNSNVLFSYIHRDTKECWQEVLEVNVFQNNNGLCYKEEALYTYKQFIDKSLVIECPDVTEYVDAATAQFHWFKVPQYLN